MTDLDDLNLGVIEDEIAEIRVKMKVKAGMVIELKEEGEDYWRIILDEWDILRKQLRDLLAIEEKILRGGYDEVN